MISGDIVFIILGR